MTNIDANMVSQLQGKRTALAWLGPVRMLVIAIIAFGYASTMPRGPGNAEYFNMLGYDPSWYGIQIIFMMSGFLALRSLHKHGSALKFLLSRTLRNLPTLAVFAGIVVLILFPLFAVPLTGGETRIDQHLRYLVKVLSCFDPDVATPGLLDNALYMCVVQGGIWTFRWGAIAFMASALLWVLGGLRNARMLALLTLGMIMLYVSIIVFAVHNPDVAYGHFLHSIVTGLRLGWIYMFGMCLYAYRDSAARTLLIPAGLLALAAVQYIVLPWSPFIEITAELGLGYLVFLVMTSRVSVPTLIGKLPDLSLGLYIYNWPAAQIVLLLMPTLTPYPLFAVSFLVTIFLSYVTWMLVSRKINFSLGRFLQPQSA